MDGVCGGPGSCRALLALGLWWMFRISGITRDGAGPCTGQEQDPGHERGPFPCERKINPRFPDVILEEVFGTPKAARALGGGRFYLGETLIHSGF